MCFSQEHSMGRKLIYLGSDGSKRLSASSQVPILTLEGCRRPQYLWPAQENGEEVFTNQQITICGGAREWEVGSNNGFPEEKTRLAAVDALWRSSPVELWKDVLNNIAEVEYGYADIIERTEILGIQSAGSSGINGALLFPHLVNYPEFQTRDNKPVCEPDEHFKAKLDYARSTDKVDLLMWRLAEGTKKSYKAAWKRWCLHRSIQKKGCWLNLGGETMG